MVVTLCSPSASPLHRGIRVAPAGRVRAHNVLAFVLRMYAIAVGGSTSGFVLVTPLCVTVRFEDRQSCASLAAFVSSFR